MQFQMQLVDQKLKIKFYFKNLRSICLSLFKTGNIKYNNIVFSFIKFKYKLDIDY